MNFTKQSKKYYIDQLKGSITNYFDFSIKSLYVATDVLQQLPKVCGNCKLPLTSSLCIVCKTENNLPPQTELPQKLVYKEKMEEDLKMEQSMILLVDLSGSMSCTYKSKYKKINEELVARILGEKNFTFLKSKIGLEKVMNNYSVYQMLLNQGESARNIAQMVKMQQTSKNSSVDNSAQNKKKPQQNEQAQQQYISRKQIIQVAVSKCITIMKNRNPQTHITVVYFNDTIQIPVDNFNDKLIIPGVEDKSVQQMIELGTQYSKKISKAKAGNIGQNLVMHLTKASQNGQTALGPALAFCFGLAKSFKYSLHQIVVVTDGMSNIGFGQTQDELQRQMAQKFYQRLALQYAKPLNCVVNVLTFQDCCIGYDILDQLVSITGGIPCQIQFSQQGGERVVTQQTFESVQFKMITAFCQYARNLCYQTKTFIACNDERIKLTINNQFKPFLQQSKNNSIILKSGIRASGTNFQVQFSIPPQFYEEIAEGTIKFVVINQFERNNKKNITVTTQKIKLLKGSKQKAEKQQVVAIQKQMKQKIKPKQIFEQDIQQYQNISIKIEQNQNISNNLDKQLLQKFKAKKQKLQTQFQTIDKLTREKMSMRSRAQKTYKQQQDDFDDGFM